MKFKALPSNPVNVRFVLPTALVWLSLSVSAQEPVPVDAIVDETAVADTVATVASAADTVTNLPTDTHFRPQQLILPGALMAIGAFGVENGWFVGLKNDVRDGFEDLRGDCRFRADDKLQYLPVIANVGLGLVGVRSRHSFRERIAATATAYVALGILTNVTKYTVKEKRPDSGKRNSFPSGHTATAFMGAELLREEYGNGWGAGAYAFATGIAFLRLYNDRHWLNDIIGGAGVGILSARIGCWLLPWERRLLGWEKKQSAVAIVPGYNAEYHAPMLSMALTW